LLRRTQYVLLAMTGFFLIEVRAALLSYSQWQEDADVAERQYCVYIMANAYHTVLYTGITNDLQRRVLEHRSGRAGTFTSKYNVTKLVYFECCDDVTLAIYREKQIKAGSREKKINLVNKTNPDWTDLFNEYFG
jgi:putative endonuclease